MQTAAPEASSASLESCFPSAATSLQENTGGSLEHQEAVEGSLSSRPPHPSPSPHPPFKLKSPKKTGRQKLKTLKKQNFRKAQMISENPKTSKPETLANTESKSPEVKETQGRTRARLQLLAPGGPGSLSLHSLRQQRWLPGRQGTASTGGSGSHSVQLAGSSGSATPNSDDSDASSCAAACAIDTPQQ